MVPSGRLRIGDEAIGIDVVFPVLHGPNGEDGTVQGMFEVCGIPYVGCGVLGSALAMDKDLAKQVVRSHGIPTADWRTVLRTEWDERPGPVIEEIVRTFSMPLFVKPATLGSSVGISRVDVEDALKDAISQAFRYDDKVVVEKGIDGREIEVAVLDGPRASVPGEVKVRSGWYTYEAKYADDSSEFEAPARLSDANAEKVRSLAEQVFVLLGLTGLSRIDFFRESSTGRFLFNEANTMPGFTSISGFPKMWLASGMTYPGLCAHLVDAAIERHDARGRLSLY